MVGVVGLEGHVADDTVVAWGAAALSDGSQLRNSLTGLTVPLRDVGRIAASFGLHQLEAALEVPTRDAQRPVILVVINKRLPLHTHFLGDTGRLGGLLQHRSSHSWQYYLFADRHAFDSYAESVAEGILKTELYSTTINADLVRWALVLDPGHPVLNALRAHLAGPGASVVYRLARASVRPVERTDEFEMFLAAFRSADEDMELKYSDGAATGGGLDVDVAAGTLHAIQAAHRSIAPTVQHTYPFLKDTPSPRFKEMIAASAELHFVPSVAGRPLGEQVARYVVLRMLEGALHGRLPARVPQTAEFQQALHRIARPTPETRLSQRCLGEDRSEVVVFDAGPASEVERSDYLDVLGCVSGLWKDNRAELSISPKQRLSVRTSEGGRSVPKGVEAIKGRGSFLRMPGVFRVIREVTATGAARFLLMEMRLLSATAGDCVTALPSAVVEGSFVVGQKVNVRLDASGVLITDIGDFEEAGVGTLASARRWLHRFASAVAEVELGQGPVKWLPASDPVEPKAVVRVLVALEELGGEADVADVVATINRLFETHARINNTRREVLHHGELLEFDRDDDQVVRWTERGRAYYRAYVAAGGLVDAF